MLIATIAVVALIAAVIVVWVLTSRPSIYYQSHDGCVNVVIATSTGGGIQHACGTAARDWCADAYTKNDAQDEAVQVQCRAAGILP